MSCSIRRADMPNSLTHLLPLAIGALSFVSVALLVDAVFIWWRAHSSPQARRLRRRMGQWDQSDQAAQGAGSDSEGGVVTRRRSLSDSSVVNNVLLKIPAIDGFSLLVSQSGVDVSVGRLMGYSLAAVLVGGGLAAVVSPAPIVSLTVALLCGLIPYAFVARKRASRLKRFDQQLPDALDVISRAMLSGYSLAGALKVVGEEFPEPVGQEFGKTHDEINFGINTRDALEHLTERVPSGDLRYMVIAILIQRETGGNLAEIFGKIASLMRERQKLAGQIKVLSADGRMSAIILGCLPFVVALGLMFTNKQYIEVLWKTPQGLKMLMVASIMMMAGALWIRNIIRIRF